jgi:hypothetical protein
MAVNSTPRTFQAPKNVGAVEFTALSGRIHVRGKTYVMGRSVGAMGAGRTSRPVR